MEIPVSFTAEKELTAMDVEYLVKVITQEVVNQLKDVDNIQGWSQPRTRILALYTGGSIGFKQSIKEMDEIRKWAQIKVVLSKKAAEIYESDKYFSSFGPEIIIREEKDNASVYKLLEGVQGVVIPLLTFNSLAKLAVGICDTLILNLVFQCLLKGIPVIAARNAADLQDQERKSVSMYRCSPGLLNLSNEYFKKLEVLGVEVVDVSQLEKQIKSVALNKSETPKVDKGGKRVIITQQDISKEIIDQGYINLPANVLITPLAKDLIQAHNLKVINEIGREKYVGC